MPLKKAVFIERDGILNENILTESQQPRPSLNFAEFKIKADALPALQKLRQAGFVLIVISNQPGISNGTLMRGELDQMDNAIRRTFPINDIMSCMHGENDHCHCRMPLPGMIIEAGFKWHLDKEGSYMISDKCQNTRAARTVGCNLMFLRSQWLNESPGGPVLDSLEEIADKIIKLDAKRHGRNT
jgi:D-glycero-D-manno-heptose 1,7-bisphosphate phosphatase